MSRPIILVQFLKSRHFPLMVKMTEEFDADIVPVITSEQGHKTFVADPRSQRFPRFHSIVPFCEEGWDEVHGLSDIAVAEELATWEKRWKIDSVARLAAYDRNMIDVSAWGKKARLLLIWMRFAARALEDRPWFFMRGGHQTFVNNLFEEACPAVGVPYLCPRDSIINGHLVYSDGKNHIPRWPAAYGRYRTDPSLLTTDRGAVAMAWLAEFLARPRRPAYAELFSLARFDPMRTIRDIRRAARRAYDYGVVSFLFDNDSLDRRLGMKGKPGATFVSEYLVAPLRRRYQRYKAIFNTTPDLAVPYVYLPLQYEPEVTTMAYARTYDDQAHLVRALASHLPSPLRLYVKEHTSMVGRRPNAFFTELSRHYNVEMVAPTVSTFDLMRGAVAVATINSTAGWEAYLMGKPVFVFGHAIYDHCKGVSVEDLTEGLAGRMRDFIDGYAYDADDVRAHVAAYFECNHIGEMGSNLESGEIATRDGAMENAGRICASIRLELIHYGAGAPPIKKAD